MGNFRCGVGGWTLAMKIDGDKVQITSQHGFNLQALWKFIEFKSYLLSFISENISLQFSFLELQEWLQSCRRNQWV